MTRKLDDVIAALPKAGQSHECRCRFQSAIKPVRVLSERDCSEKQRLALRRGLGAMPRASARCSTRACEPGHLRHAAGRAHATSSYAGSLRQPANFVHPLISAIASSNATDRHPSGTAKVSAQVSTRPPGGRQSSPFQSSITSMQPKWRAKHSASVVFPQPCGP